MILPHIKQISLKCVKLKICMVHYNKFLCTLTENLHSVNVKNVFVPFVSLLLVLILYIVFVIIFCLLNNIK